VLGRVWDVFSYPRVKALVLFFPKPAAMYSTSANLPVPGSLRFPLNPLHIKQRLGHSIASF
jgi:hypothetical protein